MLKVLGYDSREALIDAVVPAAIRRRDGMSLGEFTAPLTEEAALAKLRGLAGKNRVLKSFIGQGYYNTITPGVVLRNIFENSPGTPRTRRTSLKSRRAAWKRC